MQLPNRSFALGENWNGIANDAKTINIRVANKNYNIRGPCVVFEVKYLWKGSVKKNGVNANLVLCDWPSFRYPH